MKLTAPLFFNKLYLVGAMLLCAFFTMAQVEQTARYEREHKLNDAIALRRATLKNKVPYCTNMSTALACLEGIRSLKTKKLEVTSLQDI